MKVAAYQAPLLPGGSMAALQLIRNRVKWCETEGVDFLCCPEAVLGGLADDVECPADIAIDVESGQLEALLATVRTEDKAIAAMLERVAGESARFGVSEVRWGLFPLAGSTVRLRRQVPYTIAADILLTGRHLKAAEAKEIGLIGYVVPDGQALRPSWLGGIITLRLGRLCGMSVAVMRSWA